MEDQNKGAEAPKQGETASTGPSQQSLSGDLKNVTVRAKSASQGFDFSKLFEGRLDEKNYLYAAVGSLAVGFVVLMIPVIGMLISIALAVLGFGVTARRLHDIGISGWAALVLIVPVIGILGVIYLCWKQGDVADNPYGKVPEKNREFFKAVLNT